MANVNIFVPNEINWSIRFEVGHVSPKKMADVLVYLKEHTPYLSILHAMSMDRNEDFVGLMKMYDDRIITDMRNLNGNNMMFIKLGSGRTSKRLVVTIG